MKSNFEKIKLFVLKKKKIVIPSIIILVIILFFVFKNGNNSNIVLVNPLYGELKETVKATGTVTSKTDLNLSFKKQGIIKSVSYEVGDKVKKGDTIATLSSGSEYADLLKAKAGVLQAEARLRKVKEGYTNEEINLARIALENAKLDLENSKNTQDNLVKNAYSNLLNSNIEVLSEDSDEDNIPPTISGTYNLGKEGSILINIYQAVGGLAFSTSGLVNDSGVARASNPQPIGNSGLYITFSSTENMVDTDWIIEIPNKKASDYLANENAYNQALKTRDSVLSSAKSLVNQREAELAIKEASARGSDVSLGEAEVLSALAVQKQAESNYEDTIIRAPEDGTITKVNIKYGEVANINETAVVLEDVENLYIEALINESNIKNVKLNQPVLITFDSLKDEKFYGVVSHIDPSSLTENGVVNYKIKVSIIDKNINIRPGMNAEILVTTSLKENVLSISRATLIYRDGKYFVNKITNKDKNKYKETEVSIGVGGDGNMVEILNGINQNDIIALINSK